MAGRSASARTRRRGTLSRERVLREAVRVADDGGIAAVTMRRLATELGVEPMSLYHHVADKDGVLDGMVDVVVREINDRVGGLQAPSGGAGWKAAVRRRILTAREVLLSHPWAPGVIESRTSMSPAILRYYDDLAGLLRQGGFTVSLVHHAMHALGSRALGFTQELFAAEDGEDQAAVDMAALMGQMATEYPYITEVVAIESAKHDPTSTLGWCDDQVEFEFGLDLILDGLETLHTAQEQPPD